MSEEKIKMLSGKPYKAFDELLLLRGLSPDRPPILSESFMIMRQHPPIIFTNVIKIAEDNL
jgi:hypothetical protein